MMDKDWNERRCIYAVMKELGYIGLLNTDCMTVTGKTIGENIANAVNRNPEVIRPGLIIHIPVTVVWLF